MVLLLLEGLGYRADAAANGPEALDAILKKYYNVVLMDIQMPKLDGMETTRHIRAEIPEEKQPYIIAMSADILQSDRGKCLDAGMDDYISKPIRIWELIGTLNKCRS